MRMRDSNRTTLHYLAYPALAWAVSAILGDDEKGEWFWGTLVFLVGLRFIFYLWDWCCDWIIWGLFERPKIVSSYLEIFRSQNFPDSSEIIYPFGDGILGLLAALESENGYKRFPYSSEGWVELPEDKRKFIKTMRAQIVLDISYMRPTQANRHLKAIVAAHLEYWAERYYEHSKRIIDKV